jgi:hypothetical protein
VVVALLVLEPVGGSGNWSTGERCSVADAAGATRAEQMGGPTSERRGEAWGGERLATEAEGAIGSTGERNPADREGTPFVEGGPRATGSCAVGAAEIGSSGVEQAESELVCAGERHSERTLTGVFLGTTGESVKGGRELFGEEGVTGRVGVEVGDPGDVGDAECVCDVPDTGSTG